MKAPSTKAKVKAFTLVELLAVIFIVAIVAALLLPAKAGRGPNYTARCMNNQKQIVIGFTMWKEEHNGQFPWQVPFISGGAMNSAARGYVAPSFQVLSNWLKSPTAFICPTDKVKVATTNHNQLKNQNVSYFVAMDAATNNNVSILTGDRHLEYFNNPVKPGLFAYSSRKVMNWTHELHEISSPQYLSLGILSFADGHLERVMGADLNSVFQREGLATNHLAVP